MNIQGFNAEHVLDTIKNQIDKYKFAKILVETIDVEKLRHTLI